VSKTLSASRGNGQGAGNATLNGSGSASAKKNVTVRRGSNSANGSAEGSAGTR
jgi:hypothetical protein